MGILGVITCEILEREFSWLLARDPDVRKVTVLEDARSMSLIEQLESRQVPNVQRIPHIKSLKREPVEGLNVVIRVLETGLHRDRHVLERALIDTARELSFHVDALLLSYGACGNALEEDHDWLDVKIPVFRPMHEGRLVDDCVGLLIGGRDCYHAEQCKAPGTFFLTPGWARQWKRIFEMGSGKSTHLEALKKMFVHYTRFLLVMTPVMDEEEMKYHAEEFKKIIDLDIEKRPGTLDILIGTWESSKAYLKSKSEGYAWKQ
jgi:hypothetical protein